MTQITLKQLPAQLANKLSSVYLLSGDEPLFIQEARDSIFLAAKSHGFSEKEVHHIDTQFRSEILIGLIHNQSLFSEKKIIDIRNPNAKFDASIVDLFQSFFSNPSDDYLIVISTEKLTATQQKSPWCENIKKHGTFIPVWPLALHEFPQWIQDRAKKLKLSIPTNLIHLLAQYCEGNLLSAHQTLEKLAVLYAGSEITREQLIHVIADGARFTIFDLSDAIMRRDIKKVTRIITRLEQTDEEPTLVLWAICKKLRENSNQPNMKKALQSAASVDEIIKGGKTGNPWQAILQLSLIICGHEV